MLLEFIGTLMIGITAAGCVLIVNRLTGGRLPGWAMPAGAGAAMIGFVVWSEYTWADRVAAGLPPEVAFASRNAVTSWYRPWTYLFPFSNRISLIDHRFTRRHEAFPDQVLTAVVLMGRWEPGRQVPVVFDCAAGRRADLRAHVIIADDGAIEGADWLQLPQDDPLLRAACAPVPVPG